MQKVVDGHYIHGETRRAVGKSVWPGLEICPLEFSDCRWCLKPDVSIWGVRIIDMRQDS